MAVGSIRDVTSAQLDKLSPQLRRAARFVLDNPDEVATRSLRYVASAAKLPPPTFSRLARAMGYTSYDAMRETCRREIGRRRSLLADRALEMVSRDATTESGPFLTRHVAAAMRNAQAMVEAIDHAALARTAAELAGARQVILIGSMSAAALTRHALYLSHIALGNWRLFDESAHGCAGELCDLGAADMAIAISFEPYARRTVEIARLVKAGGVRLVAVTDSPLSPITDEADHFFETACQSPMFFPSHVTATVFIETLIAMVAQERGGDAQQRIAEIERQAHALGDYWQH